MASKKRFKVQSPKKGSKFKSTALGYLNQKGSPQSHRGNRVLGLEK